MIHPASYERGGHIMLNGSTVSFSGSVATILLASGFLLTLEAQQPPVSAPAAPAAAHNAFLTRHCAEVTRTSRDRFEPLSFRMRSNWRSV